MTHPDFTSGPWQVHCSHVYGPDPDRELVAQVVGNVPANLRLIVVATELYTALEQALDRMEQIEAYRNGDCRSLPQVAAAIEHANEVLAKVRPRSTRR